MKSDLRSEFASRGPGMGVDLPNPKDAEWVMDQAAKKKKYGLDDFLEAEINALALERKEDPEKLVRDAVAEYLRHALRRNEAACQALVDRAAATLSDQGARVPSPFGSDHQIQPEQERLARQKAKAKLASQGLRPVSPKLDGERITDGLEYQKKIRAEW